MTEEELKKIKEKRTVLTCEEAAEFIKQRCCPHYPDKVDETKWETAMHMAIEALKEKAEQERDRAEWEHWRDRGY